MECDAPTLDGPGPARYGVREFVVLTPTVESEALCSEAQAKLIASSVAIAIENTGW